MRLFPTVVPLRPYCSVDALPFAVASLGFHKEIIRDKSTVVLYPAARFAGGCFITRRLSSWPQLFECST